MSVGKICSRTVHTADPDEWVIDAAKRMKERGVGTLVVVDTENLPIGIVTDRDIALRCVADNRDPETTNVIDVMSAVSSTVGEDTAIETALSDMAATGVRRTVVTDDAGRLAGVLALDDVLELMAEEGEMIGHLLRSQVKA